MSLINEALKKAQRDRAAAAAEAAQGPRPAPVAPPPATRSVEPLHRAVPAAPPPARRAPSAAAFLPWVALAVSMVALLAAVLLLVGRDPDPAPASPAPAATPAPLAAAPATPAPASPPPATPVAAPTAVVREQPAAGPAQVAAPEPTPAATAQPPATLPLDIPALVLPTSPNAPAPASPAPSAAQAGPAEAELQAYVDELAVASVRLAGADSKAIINSRVFGIGAVVDRRLRLKIAEITANSIVFEDDAGRRFTRRL